MTLVPNGSRTGTCQKANTSPLEKPQSMIRTPYPPSPHTYPLKTVSTIWELVPYLNTGPSSEDDGAHAPKTPVELFFTLTNPSQPSPSMFTLLHKAFIRPYVANAICLFTSSLLAFPTAWEQSSFDVMILKRFLHAPFESELHRLHLISLACKRIRAELLCMFKIEHSLPGWQPLLPWSNLGLRVFPYKNRLSTLCRWISVKCNGPQNGNLCFISRSSYLFPFPFFLPRHTPTHELSIDTLARP